VMASVLGCAPGSRSGQAGGDPPERAQRPAASKALVMAIRVEPNTLAWQGLAGANSAGTVVGTQKRVFNATLAMLDPRGVALPYLAETLPELNSPDWQVHPDGRMTTIYHLRPNLAWHDGTPFSAEDFVFSGQVYATPEYGLARSSPWNRIERLTAPDDRTLVIDWLAPFPDAAVLVDTFPPLPRHILQAPFQQGPTDNLPNLAFWSNEYVGLGPYRLTNWVPAAFIEAEAFPGHALGKAKIDRIKLAFISDRNAVLANTLSGEVHMTVDSTLKYEEGVVLQSEWAARGGGGQALVMPAIWYVVWFQFRPEYVNPRAILDVRVRRALAHTVDRQGMNDALFGGQGFMSDTMFASSIEGFDVIDRSLAKYRYDPRRAEQLMAEAGFEKVDGFFASPTEGRFNGELMVSSSTQSERGMAIMASDWRKAGFEFQERVIAAALVTDGQARSTFRALGGTGANYGQTALVGNFSSARIPGPNNRWSGNNRGGWSNAELDRLADALETTLDKNERIQRIAEMTRIISEELPVLSLYFNIDVVGVVNGLHGPKPVAQGSEIAWDIHTWEWE
jgi:peptide/nickel transport system substrate-binding protein